LIATSLALAPISTGQAAADSAGTVHFMRMADSSFDQYTKNPSPEEQAWLRTHMWRMGVWSPYFDSKTSWYPNGWVYDDSYAIYTREALASEHPEWILKDAKGNKLYIPFECSEGTCPQYAADITNAAFRQYWINNLKSEIAHGYKGVFVDDVNMEMRVGNGQEQQVAPIDPATGQPMAESAWRHYMAQFMTEIRASLPASVEIVHNAIWYAAEDAGTTNADIKSELSSSSYVYLQRGVNDSGLTGGTGRWSLNTFLSYIDQIHALGKGVILDGTASDPTGLEYNLAAYYLVSTGNDAVSGGEQTPANWWAGYNTNLGEASGARYSWKGLLRRDFTGGMALVNPPGAPTVTIPLTTPMQDVNGNTVTSVTLPAATGAILRGSVPAAETSAPTSTETQTLVETSVVPPKSKTETTTSPTPKQGTGGSSNHNGGTGSSGPKRKGKAHSAALVRSRPRSAHRHSSSRRHRKHATTVLTRVHGLVVHATRGRVSIQIDERHGRHWNHFRRLTLSVTTSGHFAQMLHLRTSAHYRVRAIYTGAPGYRPSQSSYHQLAPNAR
jgi:hypothetical protein